MRAFVLLALIVGAGLAPIATASEGPPVLELEADRGPHLPGRSVVVLARLTSADGEPVAGVVVDLSPLGLRAATNRDGEAYFTVTSGDPASMLLSAAAGAAGASVRVLWSRPHVDVPSQLDGIVGTPRTIVARLAWEHDGGPIAPASAGLFEGTTLVADAATGDDGVIRFTLTAAEPGLVTYTIAFDEPWLDPARSRVTVTWYPAPQPVGAPAPAAPAPTPTPAPAPSPSPTPAPAPTPTPPPPTPSPEPAREPEPPAPTAAPTTPEPEFVRDVTAEGEVGALLRLETQLLLHVEGASTAVHEEARASVAHSEGLSLGRVEGWTLLRTPFDGSGRPIAEVQGAESWWLEDGVLYILANSADDIVVTFREDAPPVAIAEPLEPAGRAFAEWVAAYCCAPSWAQLALLFLGVIPMASRLAWRRQLWRIDDG